MEFFSRIFKKAKPSAKKRQEIPEYDPEMMRSFRRFLKLMTNNHGKPVQDYVLPESDNIRSDIYDFLEHIWDYIPEEYSDFFDTLMERLLIEFE